MIYKRKQKIILNTIKKFKKNNNLIKIKKNKI